MVQPGSLFFVDSIDLDFAVTQAVKTQEATQTVKTQQAIQAFTIQKQIDIFNILAVERKNRSEAKKQLKNQEKA